MITPKDDWVLVKRKGDIDVYIKEAVKGDFREVKILTSYTCSMHELVASLEDVPAHKDWVMNTIESDYIKKPKSDSFYYYISTDMPFPIKDRDLAIFYSRYQDEESGTVYTNSVAKPGLLPEKDDFIRIKSFTSSYVLEPDNNGKINIEYRMKVDPGGLLPAWLVNLAVTKGPINTIESLFTLLDSDRYDDAQVENIID